MIALGEHVAGQHVVGQHGGWRHENLMGHNEFLIEHGLMNLMLIGVTEQRVIAQTEKRLNGVRIFADHGPENAGGVGHLATHDDIGIGKTPDLLSGLFEHFCNAIGKGRVVVITQLLGFLLW